jgi:DUF4097 and DUF4098 domain-containing protein YvlB
MSLAKYPLSTGICALLLAYATADAETIERRAAANPRGEVEIGNVSGTVHVSGWERAEVEVQGELGEGVERLDFTSEGERTIVKVVLPPRTSADGESELTVRVPRDSRLIVRTVSAVQIIEDVRGAQWLQSVSGSIETQLFGGEFEAKTVSGDIVATGKAAKGQESAIRARASTVSGDLILTKIGGELELTTVSGDLQVDAPLLTRAYIKTTSGDMTVAGVVAKDARIDAETINGDLTLDLKDLKNAEIDVESFNGDISNCFGPKPKRKSDYGPGIALRFKEGDGGAVVRAKTLNGDIRLCR